MQLASGKLGNSEYEVELFRVSEAFRDVRVKLIIYIKIVVYSNKLIRICDRIKEKRPNRR